MITLNDQDQIGKHKWPTDTSLSEYVENKVMNE